MHTFVIAEHPEFGKIRTVEKDGKIWFCAKDVAASLGYANTRDAIDRHCKQKGVCVHDIPTRGGRQKIKFIDEGNMYRLIAGSRLPSAERFESWIFDDLVPRTSQKCVTGCCFSTNWLPLPQGDRYPQPPHFRTSPSLTVNRNYIIN